MLLYGLKYAALIGADRILLAHISCLVNRAVQFIVKTPPVPRPFAFVVRVRLAAVRADPLEDLGRLVGRSDQIVENVVVRKRKRPSTSRRADLRKSSHARRRTTRRDSPARSPRSDSRASWSRASSWPGLSPRPRDKRAAADKRPYSAANRIRPGRASS